MPITTSPSAMSPIITYLSALPIPVLAFHRDDPLDQPFLMNEEARKVMGGRTLWASLLDSSRDHLREAVDRLNVNDHPEEEISLFQMLYAQSPMSTTKTKTIDQQHDTAYVKWKLNLQHDLLIMTGFVTHAGWHLQGPRYPSHTSSPQMPPSDTLPSRLSSVSADTIYANRVQSLHPTGDSLSAELDSQTNIAMEETNGLRSESPIPQPNEEISQAPIHLDKRDLLSSFLEALRNSPPREDADISLDSRTRRPSSLSDSSETEVSKNADDKKAAGNLPPIDPRMIAQTANWCNIGLVRADKDCKILWVNEHWYKVCKVKKGESLNSWINHLHPECFPEVMSIIEQIMVHKAPISAELQWNDGSWSDFTAACEIDKHGQLDAINATVIDSTVRKKLELDKITALEEKEAHTRRWLEEAEARRAELAEAIERRKEMEGKTLEYAKMAQISCVALTAGNREGEVKWANDSFYRMHGITSGNPNDWPQTVHDDDLETLQLRWEEASKSCGELKSKHRLKNGRTILSHCVPVHNVDGTVTYVGSMTDITAQEQHATALRLLSEQRIANSKKAAIESEDRRRVAVAQKEQQALLVDVVSHELRNAINPILQSSLLIRNSLIRLQNKLNPEHNFNVDEDIEACDAIIDSANQMEMVANDVLGLSQIQLNQLAVTPVEYELGQKLRMIQRMYQADCRAKKLDFEILLGKGIQSLGKNLTMKGDPTRIQQVVVNLISNAIKFTSRSQVKRVTFRVDISTEAPPVDKPIYPPSIPTLEDIEKADGSGYLYLSVEDTGPGMNKAELAKLFIKFSQANPELHTQLGGSGLGLFITKKLCELQGGRIEAVSEVGVGSIFRCYVATKIIKPDSKSASKEVSRPLSVPTQLPNMASNFPHMRLLVCDDNVLNRRILERQLKAAGHQVTLTEDGQEAFDAVVASEEKGTRFDAILLDVNMPVMDGITCTRMIRQMERERDERNPYHIVGCTGNARPEQITSVLKSGMSTVITKPYRVTNLLEAIRPPGKKSPTRATGSDSAAGVPPS